MNTDDDNEDSNEWILKKPDSLSKGMIGYDSVIY